jgi:hypothetical protein
MIQADKLKHAFISYVICIGLGYFNILAAVLLTMGIGIGKEVYDDVTGKGTPDIYDIVADFIGIAAAVYVLLVWQTVSQL